MKSTIIEEMAFLVHEPVLWTHYSGVWEALGKDNFTIVVTRQFKTTNDLVKKSSYESFLNRAESCGYKVVWAKQLLQSRTKFRHLVTNHKIGGFSAKAASSIEKLLLDAHWYLRATYNTFRGRKIPRAEFEPKQYWPLQIGVNQIRFMYGADVGDGWSLSSWNQIYSAFLCHGPNDANQIKGRFSGQTYLMGYPRYDGYFNEDSSGTQLRSEFDLKPDLKTILWMPTFGAGACSIPTFAREISTLSKQYNLIVRPHPLTFRENPEDIGLLQSLGFKIDQNATRDMNPLFRIADALLCDYGGSAFGALYLGKRMVLLDLPGADRWYTVRNSSNLELNDHYPSVSPNQVQALRQILEDESYWADRSQSLRHLADNYFADFRGTSSKRAAEILSHITNIPTGSAAGRAEQ